MHVLPIAEVVWYVTGRFYLAANQSMADYGYFLHLAGISAPLFAGPIGASTAHFTFAAQPFAARTLQNGSLAIGLDPVGEFSLFLQRAPAATFDAPTSFARGECIATFRRAGLVVGTTLDVGADKHAQTLISSNVFSAHLIDSVPFDFAGARYDMREIVARGVTQFGTAAAAPVEGTLPGYSGAFPFTGSAIRLG